VRSATPARGADRETSRNLPVSYPVPPLLGSRGVEPAEDYYEVLQISPNAEPETIHRVYRLLAQRLHPDNAETGDEAKFRVLCDAYEALGDPERRARYDVTYTAMKQQRWRLIASNDHAQTDVESEQLTRLVVLELLYVRRRTERDTPGLSPLDLEALTGRAREHLEFTLWYLAQKKYVMRSDSSDVVITAEGVDYMESNFRDSMQRRRLPEASAAVSA
jgi:curved DNA-binding protein CbpA